MAPGQWSHSVFLVNTDCTCTYEGVHDVRFLRQFRLGTRFVGSNVNNVGMEDRDIPTGVLCVSNLHRSVICSRESSRTLRILFTVFEALVNSSVSARTNVYASVYLYYYINSFILPYMVK